MPKREITCVISCSGQGSCQERGGHIWCMPRTLSIKLPPNPKLFLTPPTPPMPSLPYLCPSKILEDLHHVGAFGCQRGGVHMGHTTTCATLLQAHLDRVQLYLDFSLMPLYPFPMPPSPQFLMPQNWYERIIFLYLFGMVQIWDGCITLVHPRESSSHLYLHTPSPLLSYIKWWHPWVVGRHEWGVVNQNQNSEVLKI